MRLEPELADPIGLARRRLRVRLRSLLPELPERQWRMLALLSAASFFNQYDRALFALALPQIQASLGIAEGQVGLLGSLVRLGALPAFGIALAADRVGRRRTLLATILAYTALTGATAAAPDVRSFVLLQFFAAAFSQAGLLLAIVVLAEELPADQRGRGIGAFFALQSAGTGLAAALLPLAGASPDGWRALYAVGLLPLLLVARFWRALPETRRFETSRAASHTRASLGALLEPVRELVREYPGRFVALMAVTLLWSAGGAGADFMGAKYLQQAHGWRPGDVTLLYLGGGVLAILGSVVAGRMGDGLGRRRVTVLFGLATAGGALAFYNVSGWLLPLAWIAAIFALVGGDTLLATYGAELFPTSHRATASGARLVAGTLGAAAGLAAESALYAVLGSHWAAISVLLGLLALAPVLVAAAFPETARRSLEDVSPEREPARGNRVGTE